MAKLRLASAGGENDQMLLSQWIWIHYGPILASITGRSSEKVMVSKGCPFWMILDGVLQSYPKIEANYPAESGLLGFTLNGAVPEPYALLCEGDVITFDIPCRPGPFTVQ